MGIIKRHLLSSPMVVVGSTTVVVVVVSIVSFTIWGSLPSLVFAQSNEGLNTKMKPR